MNMKKKRKGVQSQAPRCPYCGSHTILRSADGIYQDNSKGVMLYAVQIMIFSPVDSTAGLFLVYAHTPEADAFY